MIQINQLHKSFGRKKVLEGVSLSLDGPGIYAILGPNASGKTTLIKSILGMVLPSAGTIRINGENIIGEHAYREKINYLPQIARFPDNLKVSELFGMLRSLRHGNSREIELIDLLGLADTLNSRLGHLSGGTRQKVSIVAAMMYDNPLTIMDEPSAGLDPMSLQLVKKLILEERQMGKQVLVTTHIMGLVEELADNIVYLLDGAICFEGPPESLKAQYGSDNVERAIANLLMERNG